MAGGELGRGADGGRGGGGKGYSSWHVEGITPAQSGLPSTGGGGGGSPTGSPAGSGGSGVVIVRYKQLPVCVNQEQQCGTDYYHDGSDCVKCPAGTTRQPGAANKCTPSGSGNVDNGNNGGSGNSPAPAPAESKKRQAEERAKKMNAGITDPMQKKKADLLAAAAIGGNKVKKLKFAQPVQAASPDDACAQAYDKAGVRSSLGACVATQTSSSGRRLVASQYDVELLFSSAEVDDAALTEAVNSLKANGLESTTSSVDPIEELKIIPGVDVTELATFETEAKAAAEEAEAQSPPEAAPPPPPSPPPPLVLDDDDHAPGRAGALLVTAFATLACVLFV